MPSSIAPVFTSSPYMYSSLMAGHAAMVNQQHLALNHKSGSWSTRVIHPAQKANNPQQQLSLSAHAAAVPFKKQERKHPVYLDWSDKYFFDPIDDESKAGRGGPKAEFPALLYQILEDAETDNFADICSWLPHGRAFAIYNKQEFAKKIMPKYRSNKDHHVVKYSSFRRQLNLYGFLRLMGKDFADTKNSYYHEMFLRGRRDLLANMARIKVNGKRRRGAYDLESEPKLHEFPPMPPLLPSAKWPSRGEEAHELELDKACDDDRSPNKQQGIPYQKETRNAGHGTTSRPEENNPAPPKPYMEAENEMQSEKEQLPKMKTEDQEGTVKYESNSTIMTGKSDDKVDDDIALAAFLQDLFS